MSFVYSISLFLAGSCLYFYKKGAYFYHYVLLWLLFAPALFNIFKDISQEEYWQILSWATKLGYIALLDGVLNRNINDLIKKTIVLFTISVGYVSLLAILRGSPFVLFLKYGLECFAIISGVTVFITRNPKCNSLYKLLKGCLIFEIIIALLQINFQSLNFKCAFDNVVETNMELVISGTFLGNNTFCEFITCLAIIVIYLEYKIKGKIAMGSFIVMMAVTYLTFKSGVRTALVALLVPFGFAAVNFLKRKKTSNLKIVSIFVVCILSVWAINHFISLLSDSEVTYTKDASTAKERQAVLTSIFVDPTYLIEHTTFALSYSVIESLPSNLLFGPGQYFKGGYRGLSFKDDSSITDATLALFIGEFGIIGIVLLGTILYTLLSQINEKKEGAIVMFFYLLVVSITDNGIFAFINLFLLISMVVLEKRLNIKELALKNK